VETRTVEFALSVPESVTVENPSRDYTPPHLITLLFTDLGVLTPSAISDELIQLFS
jgi:translation initiation factor eIF-2B subunit alpha